MTKVSEMIATQLVGTLNQRVWADIIYNVKDPRYGAKGDGVTDDTAAIQAAANAIPDGQSYFSEPGKAGGILFLPMGNYRISSPILIDRPGVRIVGVSVEASVISPLSSFAGEGVFIFKNGTFAIVGIGGSNFRIDMGGYGTHGIVANKAYDQISFVDIDIRNVSDTGNGFRFEPQTGYFPDPISQTILMMNCMAVHKNRTATTPLYYFDSCQEMNIIGCKAIATYESQVDPPTYSLSPVLNPFYF